MLGHLAWLAVIVRLRLCSSQIERSASYDFIVVGAGSAGSVLASELAVTQPDKTILLIEEGSFSNTNSHVTDASKYFEIMQSPTVEKFYVSTPQKNLNGRSLSLPRAKVTGGCNAHNGQNYRLAHEKDFKKWGDIPGWTLDDILDTWQTKIEPVNRGRNLDANNGIMQRLINASILQGYPYNPDVNNIRQGTIEGGSPLFTQSDIVNDTYVRRRTAWTDFMEPILPRDNLDVFVLTRVDKVLLSDASETNINVRKKAIGVQAVNVGTGALLTFYARVEVILCAGSYDTPKLLMLSGIGDCAQLTQQFGDQFECKVDIPGVGKNLQDHIEFNSLVYAIVPPRTDKFVKELPPLALNQATALWGLAATSKGADIVQEVLVVASNQAQGLEVELPDWIHLEENPYFLLVRTVVNKLSSRGTVGLYDMDPKSKPKIDHNYMDTVEDEKIVVEAMKLGREFLYGNNAFGEYINATSREHEILLKRGLILDKNNANDEAMLEYVKAVLTTGYHPSGTCKMSQNFESDNMAVVDKKLKVRNIDNLRIVDASIMPVVVAANINQVVMIIAKKAAEFINQDIQLQSVCDQD